MANEAAPVYRLKDIDTEEVSIVDRAANQRTFLVVKAGADMSKAGQAIVPDGKGGHTVAKEVPATEAAPAAAPAAPTGTPAAPTLQLSPEAKAELLKRFNAAEARIAALKSMIAESTEVQGLVEMPNDIIAKVAELLSGIAEGEPVAKGEVKKGLPQFSSARMSQLQAARDALDAVIGSVTPAPAAAPEVPPDVAPPAAPSIDEAVTKAVTGALSGIEAKIAKAFDGIATIVAAQSTAITKQAERVAAVETSRPLPNSASATGATEVDKADEVVVWPTDMADPSRHDVTKADPETRFTK